MVEFINAFTGTRMWVTDERAEEYKAAVSNLKDKMNAFNRTGDVASLEAARKAIAEVINANVSFKKVESEIKKEK